MPAVVTFPAALPIVQAPMAGVQDTALAIAVGRAGGLGSLPCAMLSADELTAQLQELGAAGVTNYNLNFFCHETPTPDESREARWRAALKRYYDELEISAETGAPGAGRRPFSAEVLERIRPFEPRVVSFHFGLPRREWVDEIKGWGGLIWSTATTVEEARWLENRGADAIIVQGLEAGGHRGMFLSDDLATQTPTRELLSGIRRQTRLPLIAAGGIASPEHVRTYLDAGARAVQVGTAYLCCDESNASPSHRSLLTQSGTPATQLTNLMSGRPARGLANRLMRELGPISEIAPAIPLAAGALAPLRAAAEARGLTDFSPLWSGTDTSGCREVGAGELTRWLTSLSNSKREQAE